MLEGGDEDKSYRPGLNARKTANCNFDGTTTNRASMGSRLFNFWTFKFSWTFKSNGIHTENYSWLAFL